MPRTALPYAVLPCPAFSSKPALPCPDLPAALICLPLPHRSLFHLLCLALPHTALLSSALPSPVLPNLPYYALPCPALPCPEQ